MDDILLMDWDSGVFWGGICKALRIVCTDVMHCIRTHLERLIHHNA